MYDDTVVFFHAHPDDEAIFTGLTMRRLADAGTRVVLATATAGELGDPLVPLAPGETLAARRCHELEAAAEELGVARLVLFGRRDSGMPGWADNAHPDALAAACHRSLAARLADLCLVEQAAALVHYDSHGIYGHPDHVAVHRIGRLAAHHLGITAYEATVDREHLHLAQHAADGDHLVHAANQGQPTPYGRVTAEIRLAVAGDAADLAAKRRAMGAHASQITAESVDLAGFAEVYGLEWYLREGPPATLDRLGNAHAIV
ncbi:MAG TPA: PIG-L family deacetylase [Mycobacteriales bacterium]|nr:PIG-L family deacetylase [Mycobacteriales bacterium]